MCLVVMLAVFFAFPQPAYSASEDPQVVAAPGNSQPESAAGGDAAEESKSQPASDGTRRISRGAMLVGSLTVFFLAVFVGFEVITKVPPTLHTPLMSGSNAISGITVVGAMLTAGAASIGLGSVLGTIALVLATINVVGGFLVTYRMLKMFQSSKR
ncbi:MAG: hypothetical protein Aurels2KO_34180 [Aureliella sp.]